MTTGNILIGGYAYAPSLYQRTWTGADGRYEGSGTTLRNKFNDYTCTRDRHVATLSTAGHRPSFARSAVTPWTANDDVKLEAKLLEAVKNHTFNLGVALGEGKQTVELIVSTARTLGGAIRALHRGNFAAAYESLWHGNTAKLEHRLERDRSNRSRGISPRINPYQFHGMQRATTRNVSEVGSRWLELQYGWLPLLDDVYQAGTAFAAIANRQRKERVSVSRRVGMMYDDSDSVTNWHCYTSCQVSHRIIYEMREDLGKLGILRDLGLLDPLSIAWELLPFSFIVDWAIPIGTYLENLNQIPYLTGRFQRISHVIRACPEIKTISPDFSGATGSRYYSYHTRVCTAGITATRPTFKSLPQALSAKHVQNALALLSQAFH